MPRREWTGPDRGRGTKGMPRLRGLAMLAGALAVLGACEGEGIYDLPTDPGPGPGPGPVPPSAGRGELVSIPGVGILADLVVDPGTAGTPPRVFVSNLGQHRVEVMRLDSLGFVASIPVGSQPWGLSLNWNRAAGRTGDTLIVANSGGTNISFVSTATLREDVGRRFDIPRITLYEIDFETESVETAPGVTRVDTIYPDIRFFNYADRPQHVVQDARGRLLYSAVSTAAAPVGSMRIADWQPGWREWDARYFFHERSLVRAENTLALANADSVFLTGDRAVIFDHLPGSVPRQPLVSPPLRVEEAVAWLRQRGSDVEVYAATWRVPESVALADTTYVAASGDRRFVVVGEGARDRASRIVMWAAETGNQSLVEDIADIVNNTADFVSGVELNANGTLGVARGARASYFFGNDLRLQGLTPGGGGGRGAAFLPAASTNRTYAFEPTDARTVRVLETTHYRAVGSIPVREAITGPFRVGPPRPGTAACPANLAQAPADCIAATVYGVPAQRRVLVLDVRRDDIIP
jgi:hypothetical protein